MNADGQGDEQLAGADGGSEAAGKQSGPSALHRDLVAVGEFSELVGPVARHLLPKLHAFSHETLSGYVLKFMSCDFQQTQSGHSGPGGLLAMQAQDSQVLLPLPDGTGFAYVHHVVLLDVVARGYVRPFCVCYIAHEPDKIMKNFAALLAAMNQICDLLKRGNQKAFHRDLLLLIDHVEQKKAALLAKIDAAKSAPPLKVALTGTGSGGDDDDEQKKATTSLKVLHTDEATARSPALKVTHAGDGAATSSPALKVSHADDSSLLHTDDDRPASSSSGSSPALKVMQVDGNSPALKVMQADDSSPALKVMQADDDSATTSSPALKVTQADGSSPALKVMQADDSSPALKVMQADDNSPALKVTPSDDDTPALKVTRPDNDDDDDDDDNNAVRTTPRAGLKVQHSDDGQESTNERTSTPSLRTPSLALRGSGPGSQYATSLRNVVDFIGELRAIEAEFRSQLARQEVDGDLQDIVDKVASLSSSGASGKFFALPTIAADAKKDCYDQSAAAEQPDFSQILNNIMDAADDELRRTGLKTLRSLGNLCGGSGSAEYTAACYRLHLLHMHFSRPSIVLEFEQEERHALHPSSSLLSVGRSPVMNFNWEPDALPPGVHGYDPLQPLVLGGTALESFAASLWSVSSYRTGHGLLRLCADYHFLPHVVFSIMTGRPTIVYGPESQRRRVRQLIRALSLFVPGISTSGRWIEEWRQSPLRLLDLSYYRLVGLEKKPHMLPDVVKRHSTIFDVEENWIWCPPYGGDFLASLLAVPHARDEPSWPTEEVFLAYVHEQLYQFSLRAALYYHLCCVGVAESALPAPLPPLSSATSKGQSGGSRAVAPSASFDTLSSGSGKGRRARTSSLSLLPSSSSKDAKKSRTLPGGHVGQDKLAYVTRETTADMYLSNTSELLGSESLLAARFHSTETSDLRVRDLFFERFGVKEHDQQIIEYLVRLIKTEQAIEMETMSGSPNLPAFIAPTLRLAPVPCQKFTNYRPTSQSQGKRGARASDEKRR